MPAASQTDGAAPIVVIGGGISGLTIAFLLKKSGCDVRLVETGPRPGGVIETHREDGWLFEFGPNTVLANEKVDVLVHEAGLAAERLTASPAAKTRFVVRGGRLVPLPSTPPAFFTSPLFGFGAKFRVLMEPFVRPNRGADESIADFVRRRLGQEMLDYAVGPFVSGVYAGDPEKLSVRHAVKKIHALEANHGSLIKGALALAKAGARARREARATAGDGAAATGGGMSVTPRGALLSFRDGLETLPLGLARFLGSEFISGTTVTAVEKTNDGFVVRTDAQTALAARRVIVAVDAPQAAAFLAPLDTTGAMERARIAEIPYAGVVVTGLGFRKEDVGHPLRGFGFLAPRVEPERMLGCLFVSSLFPGRAPEGHHALTVIYGGAMDREAVSIEEGDLLDMMHRELTPLLDLRGKPVLTRIRRWPRAIPQYNLGHEGYLAAVRSLEAAHSGLTIAGNWVDGVSVGDCIRSGSETAASILAAENAAS